MTEPATLIACLDLTNLDDDCDDAAVDALCERALTPLGPVAAVCLWPHFVGRARERLGKRLPIATVANFPGGDADDLDVIREVDAALADGADEIDLVLRYRDFLAGERDRCQRSIDVVARQTRAAGAHLKVIIESGELATDEAIRDASNLAIDAGADFIKTSTGKVAVNATPQAAALMLDVIAGRGGSVGFKAAGGIRSAEQAAEYYRLAQQRLGDDWPTPARFRLGASSLLDALLADA
jgi:deoxyribose-phosphate aldolase